MSFFPDWLNIALIVLAALFLFVGVPAWLRGNERRENEQMERNTEAMAEWHGFTNAYQREIDKYGRMYQCDPYGEATKRQGERMRQAGEERKRRLAEWRVKWGIW